MGPEEINFKGGHRGELKHNKKNSLSIKPAMQFALSIKPAMGPEEINFEGGHRCELK